MHITTSEGCDMELLAQRLIRDVKDFPKAGIVFKDINPVIQDGPAFREVIDRMLEYARGRNISAVAGIESRGFIFGAPLALALNVGFVPVRKLGKLPGETLRAEYSLEYGTNTVEVQKDAVKPGDRVLIVDDLLATGGTAAAAAELVEKLGADVAGIVVMVELGFLNGRESLTEYDLHSLIEF
jgi:adenine phosphoribosyltransferase